MKNSGERTIDYRGILEALLSSSMSKLDVESPSVSVITITIEAERFKSIISEYPDLLSNKDSIEADGMVYDNISDLPINAHEITIALDLKPFNCIAFKDCSSLVDRMASSMREDKYLLEEGLYIIDGKVYSGHEAIDTFASVREADSCYQLLHAFKCLADYKSGNNFFIIGGVSKLLEYSTNGLKGSDLCDVRCGLDAFLAITNGKDERLKQILRSEINNHVPMVASPLERVVAFLNSIEIIISSFRLCESRYLHPFESQNLRAAYYKEIKSVGNEIRNSLQNLKAELLVFLSMFFAMSEVYISGDIEIKILVFASLLIAGILCFALLCSDRKQLKDVQTKIDYEIKELRKIEGDKETEKDNESYLNEFYSLKKSAQRNNRLLMAAQVASFLPLIMAVVIMVGPNMSQATNEIMIKF